MPIQPGQYDGTIRTNDIRTINGKEYILLMVDVSDDYEQATIPVKIWLTEKAMRMARAALRKCQFDVDAEGLEMLTENGTYLAGRVIGVTVEDQGKYGLQGSVNLDKVAKGKLKTLTSRLRAAKGEDDASLPPAVTTPPAASEPPQTRRELAATNKVATEAALAESPDIPF